MKKDNLESFVEENKENLDFEFQDERVWRKIQDKLSVKNMSKSLFIWKVAASLLFIMLSFSVYFNIQEKESQSVAVNTSKEEFADLEKYYDEQINQKLVLLDNFKEHEDLNEDTFEFTFHQMKTMYLVLKEQYSNNPSQEVVDAMVLNLLIRVDLLNSQINMVDKQGNNREEFASQQAI